MSAVSHLLLAVRAHTVPVESPTQGKKRVNTKRKLEPTPRHTLVFDCETRTDVSQRLTFGCYRVYDGPELIDEGIFHADNLPAADREMLRQYFHSHTQGGVAGAEPPRLLTRIQFLKEVFYKVAFKGRGAVVGFNLPFDISRVALGWSKPRAPMFKGGFSFYSLDYVDEKGKRKPSGFHPRIAIKAIDSKRALIAFTSMWCNRDPAAQSRNRQPTFRGFFVDCRTLTFALTGETHSLESACEAFGVEHGKFAAKEQAEITPDSIDSARQRVLATWELYQKLLDEFERHPIALQPNHAYSPATIGKSYLKAMGVKPPRLRVDKGLRLSRNKVNGYAMAAYYGGRAECHIRKVPVPVVYCDFQSMYPTVNILMGFWDWLTADYIVAEDATAEAVAFLNRVTADDLFQRSTWKESLPVLVQIVPDDDLLPARANYGSVSRQQYSIGANFVTSANPLWYTMADCVVSKLRTGKPPRVVRAIRFRPVGRQGLLAPISLRGAVPIDPQSEDFFQKLVQARHAVKADESMAPQERAWLERCLKTIANSTSYGIFIELNRQDDPKTKIDVYGTESFQCLTDNPEGPGAFYSPILGTLITGAARLMLALAEAEVRRLGGTFAFMDTDSIAIVASKSDGLIHCAGGSEKTEAGEPAIRALSWAQVDTIVERFAQLNPYDQLVVPGSVLKLEDQNFAHDGGNPREEKELWCYVMAAKRYALFNLDGGEVRLRKFSEHGLGQYLPPVDPASGELVRDWMSEAWKRIVCGALGKPVAAQPKWMEQFARTQIAISTPAMLRWFRRFNILGRQNPKSPPRPYAACVKPFNSFEHAPLDPMIGRPAAVPKQVPFCLVTADLGHGPKRWVNIYDPAGPFYRVVGARRDSVGETDCIGRTYGDVIAQHSLHAESKSLGPDGAICDRRACGVLSHRRVRVIGLAHIGKEANELELVQADLIIEEEQVLNTYKPDMWPLLRQVLAEIPAERIQKETGYSRRQVYYLRTGRRHPAKKRLSALLRVAARWAREQLFELGEPYDPRDDEEAVRLYAEVRCKAKSRGN